MGRRCTVCDHPERAKIELGLARKVPSRKLAQKFDVGEAAIRRHKDGHMPPQLMASLMTAATPSEIDLDQLRQSESEGILQHLVAERGRLYNVADEAERLGDFRSAIQAHRAINDNISTTAKLLGELSTGSQTTINNNLVVAPEYLDMRNELIRALRPYPEACRAVAQVLRRYEGAEPHQTGTHQKVLEHAGG
ncbi:hypothetical protein CKO28_09810 [Rhodovibrio sodomensis]|uniref:Uncharacterized protein n=1 Tax=Rhodovibrio sodomensis TaxID=1088 RepID=A0ABS1DEL3_9PROT|nr:hypothetical protein [Rhodovibrio sodomensis]MBK1668329.1 hypothetical protein [Rhodovibrio sodomensis]